MDGHGNVYIADTVHQVVERVDATTRSVTVVAGVLTPSNSTSPVADGALATSGSLATPAGVAVDTAGNLYIAEQGNHRIRKVDHQTGIISTVAGNGSACAGTYATCAQDGSQAVAVAVDEPAGVAVDAAGNIYISQIHANAVRKVDSTGKISTVFGGSNPVLNNPAGISLDGAGGLYVADSQNNEVWKVVLSSGTGSVIAGKGAGSGGFNGDGGMATSAKLSTPYGVWADPAGNVYIADYGNNRIRFVNAKTGIISTVAGNGVAGPAGDGGNALLASLNNPYAVVLDGQGNLYISDSANNALRKVIMAPTAITWSVAGANTNAGVISFGSQLVSTQSAPTHVVLTNSGNSAAKLSPISISSFDFSVQQNSNCTQPLQSGASCDLYVTFTPQTGDVGALTAFLTYTDDLGNAPRSVPFTGTSLSGQASSKALDFGNVAVNTSAVMGTITLTNTAASPLYVYGVTPTFGGTGFSIGGASANCTGTLVPNGNCQLTVQLSPTMIGLQTGTVSFITSADTNPIVANVRATVVGVPKAVLSPSGGLSFGNQNIGSGSAPQAVTLSNSGTASLAVNSITMTGSNAGDFSVSQSCGSAVGINSQCSITVRFVPTGAGTRSAVLTVSTNASNSPQTLAMTGVGVGSPQAAISTGNLSFSYQNLGSASSPQVVTLANPGSVALNIASIQVVGMNAADFSPSSSCGSSLAPGASCGISVTFTPSDDGSRTASLMINDAVGTQTVSLSGTGSGNYSVPGCTVLTYVAGPNPIYTNNPYGITSINANVTCPYDIRVGSANGPLFATGNGYSSSLTGNWVTDGVVFYLQQSGNTTPSGTLANLTVHVKTGQGCIATGFTASPNPIITSGPYGQTTITAATNCSFDIRIGGPTGPEFHEGRGYSVFQTGNWVTNQMSMYLQPHGDTTAAGTLSVLTLVVQSPVAGCTVNDFSVNPNPIITTQRLNTATIHADSNCPYDVRTGGPNGALLGTSVGSTNFQTGNWVVNGMSFFLQKQGNTTASGTLATVTATTELPPQTIPSCTITQFAATANPLSAPGPMTVNVNANCPWDLRFNDAKGALLASGNGAGSGTASSVSDGSLFYLQPQGDTNWQHNLAILRATVNPQPPACTALIFSSTPIVADSSYGVTNITADATCSYDIRVNGPNGQLFGSASGLSSANSGNWVQFGQVFYMQKSGDTTSAGTLATTAAIIIP